MYEHCQMNSAPFLLRKKKTQRNKHIFTSLQIWRLHFAFHLPNYLLKLSQPLTTLNLKDKYTVENGIKWTEKRVLHAGTFQPRKALHVVSSYSIESSTQRCLKISNPRFISLKAIVYHTVFCGCVIIPPREQTTFLCQIWGPMFSLVVPNTVLSPRFKNLPKWE